jgi:hypothetical protein
MLESLTAFIKTFPTWLGTLTEILVVGIGFATALTLLMGVWIGILVVKRRARSIKSFTLIPFGIEFYVSESKEQRNAAEEGK